MNEHCRTKAHQFAVHHVMLANAAYKLAYGGKEFR
jgi:hypothetical protein